MLECHHRTYSLLATGNMQPPRGPIGARGEWRVLPVVAVNGIFQGAGEQRATYPIRPRTSSDSPPAVTEGGSDFCPSWSVDASGVKTVDVAPRSGGRREREGLEFGLNYPLPDTIIYR